MAKKHESEGEAEEDGSSSPILSRIRDISYFKLNHALCIAVLVLVTLLPIPFYHLSRPVVLITRNEPLVWITPRFGGFNNQMITIYEGVNCARIYNRTVVLPLMYENVRYDTSFDGTGPYPFEDYFNLSALKQVVPVITPAELDRDGLPCNTIYFTSSGHGDSGKGRTPRLLKQQYAKRYRVNLRYLPSFSYPTDQKCVDDSVCRLQDSALLGNYSSYEVSGQGYDIRSSAIFKEIRAAFQPCSTVLAISKLVTDSIETRFNAVHLRRGDYQEKCSQMPADCKKFGKQSMFQNRTTILNKVKELRDPTLPLFVSTTHVEECRNMLKNSGLELFFLKDIELPSELKWAKKRTDILAFADRIVASEAEQFIGNRFSSFSAEINNHRYLRNSSDELVFF